MTLPPLTPAGRMGDQVVDQIRAAIMNGSYPAGHRLRIRELASQLGTSVMPVREAIGRLEELGLVETQPNRGATVKAFTRTDLLHVYAVRRVLEVEAACLGAAHIDAAGLADLQDAFTALEQALSDGDTVGYLDADEHFLTILYGAAGNPVLSEMLHLLWQRCRSYKIIGADSEAATGELERLLTFQRGLLEAADEHDVEQAGQLTAASIDAATERIRQLLPES